LVIGFTRLEGKSLPHHNLTICINAGEREGVRTGGPGRSSKKTERAALLKGLRNKNGKGETDAGKSGREESWGVFQLVQKVPIQFKKGRGGSRDGRSRRAILS